MNRLFSTAPVAQSNGVTLVRIITGFLLVWHGWEIFDAEKMKVYTGWFVERKYFNADYWLMQAKLLNCFQVLVLYWDYLQGRHPLPMLLHLQV